MIDPVNKNLDFILAVMTTVSNIYDNTVLTLIMYSDSKQAKCLLKPPSEQTTNLIIECYFTLFYIYFGFTDKDMTYSHLLYLCLSPDFHVLLISNRCMPHPSMLRPH